MTNKEAFIKLIQKEIFDSADVHVYSENDLELFTMAQEYFREFTGVDKPLPEKSAALLAFMQEHKEEYKNLFSSAAVATAMGTSGKSVAGSMRSLVSKGYVEKIQSTPVTYSLVE